MLTISYSEILDSSIALTAFTNGQDSDEGGTIKVGDYDRTSIPIGDVGVSTYVTAVSAVSSADYVFTGWQFDGSNYNHIRYKLNLGDASWSTPSAQNTTVGTSSDTTIYIKTDGTSGLTTADAIVKAMFVTGNRTVTTAALLATDGTGYSSTLGGFSPTLTGANTYAAAVNPDDVTLTANEPAGYKFVGWHVSDNGSLTSAALNSAVQGTSGIYTYTANTRTLSFTMNTTCDLHYYALYKKIYYITVYDSYHYDVDPETGAKFNFVFRTSPPRTVTVTNTVGTTTNTCNYIYNAGNVAQRGEDDQYANGGTLSTDNTKQLNYAADVTFYEGNNLEVLAGDTVVMTYSTLSSSDAISGVFFNNGIRYTTELEPDNLYVNRVWQGYTTVDGEDVTSAAAGTGDDRWNYTYAQDTTLFADPDYFRAETVPGSEVLVTNAIANATANDHPYRANVNQDAHTVTFTVDQDYRNIDISLASKRQIVFSDTKNAKINSINVDNYYSVGEDISTSNTAATRLAVYAKGNEDQKTTITLANVNLYYYNAEKGWFTDATGAKLADQTQPVALTGTDATITKAISTGTSISTSTSSDSTAYIYFTGTMPNTDVYVDLAVNVEYTMYIGSKIVSDVAANKNYLGEVATIRATFPDNTTQTTGNVLYNTTSKTCTAGNQIKYELVSWGTDSDSSKPWSTYYMFLGWYIGNSSGPYYEDKYFLGNDVTLYYTPKKNTYIYAVGTRDMFISGSKYVIGTTQDWNEGDSYKRIRMNFDPDFSQTVNGTVRYGRYYWTITDDLFKAANYQLTYTSHASAGNSFFQFYDVESGDDKNVWKNIGAYTNTNNNGIPKYGKDLDGADGYGYIKFTEAGSPGYSSPITIYYYPHSGFDIEATPIYPHIYLSNGFKNIDKATPDNVSISVNGTASGNNSSSANTTVGKAYYEGSGWTGLAQEGTVRDIQIKAKNAEVKITKTVAAGYKVSYFFVYNIATKKVSAVAATDEGSNTYSATVKMNNDEKMYICPIVESISADMTVMFDASQLDYSQWGAFVSCYAWYDHNGTISPAYGNYPGQLMVPYDGGLSWQAKFPSTKASGGTLVGITFANYINDENGTPSTWLGGNSVMGTATYTTNNGTTTASLASGGIINKYNELGDGNYQRYNSKVQTYDYREPIAFFENSDAEQKLMTFAVKNGNGNLIAWNYDDLTLSDPNYPDSIKAHIGAVSWPLSFEYLVDQKGKYVDLNGVSMSDKPTPSFYVCAKGMVTYTNNNMVRQFVGGNGIDPSYTENSITYTDAYGAASGVSMSYAVQWYIYDAAGHYVDTVLSAGYADKSAADIAGGSSVSAARTQIAAKLENAGYAVSGRSVAICYDMPRYCYNTPNNNETNAGIANGGVYYDAYRFTGQWLQQNSYETAQVSVEVGLRYAGDVTMSGASSTDYGAASVIVDKSKLTHKIDGDGNTLAGTGVDEKTGLNYGMVTIVEGNKGALTITANDTNFEGWYYYEGDELKLATEDASYTPGVGKDITYYAIYSAKATYKLNYTGREGDSKSYTVSGGDMTAAEIGNSNTVSTDRNDFDTSLSGAAIQMFKKTVTLSTHTNLDNSVARTLQATLTGIADETFTLTYYYPDTKGGSNAAHATGTTSIAYNTLAQLPIAQVTAMTSNAPVGKRFVGWYTAAEGGTLLSSVANYGMRIVKDTTIYAHYDTTAYTPSASTSWNVTIDDYAITKEMTSTSSGKYYSDTIIRVTGNNNVSESIPSTAKAGVIIIRDDGSNADTTRTAEQLKSYITRLGAGKTAKINGTVLKATNIVADNNTLTTYNRADLSLRSDYAASNGQNYSIYAYVMIDADHIYLSAVQSGTYN